MARAARCLSSIQRLALQGHGLVCPGQTPVLALEPQISAIQGPFPCPVPLGSTLLPGAGSEKALRAGFVGNIFWGPGRRPLAGIAQTLALVHASRLHASATRHAAVPMEKEAEADGEAEQRSPPTERVRRLVDEITELTLLEVADLTKLLKQKLGMSDMPMGMPMMMPGMAGAGMAAPGASAEAAAEAAEPVKEEKTSFDVKLEKFDAPSKLKVIKEVRAITGLGLKESKELVESAPAVVKKGVPKDEAESIMGKLTAVGAQVVME